MKLSMSAKLFLYLMLPLICVTSIGCRPDFGEKIVANKTDIFFKDGATKADAERLRDRLEEMNFIDGNRKSVQLAKRGDIWEFRVATAKGALDGSADDQLKLYCLDLSSAFDGDEVEVHLCNQKLETKSIVKGLRGERYRLGKNTYFYKDVELEQVKNFAAIAFGTELDTSTGFVYHLSKPESVVKIRMAYPKSTKGDKRIALAARETAVKASSILFDDKEVDVIICNAYFDNPTSYSSTQKAAKVSR